MINTVIFSDEIKLWWEKTAADYGKSCYRILQGGKEIGTTHKTHFTVGGLSPSTEYSFKIEKNGKLLGEVKAKTGKQKRRIDVTKAPYFAVGDGVTMNTAALQKALDDCTENDVVYFPKGVYLTGSLKMHGDMELYIEKDATIQGSDKPEDYLPKIRSRFEGIETECYSPLIRVGELDSKSRPTTANIIIRGEGSILGGGRVLCDAVIDTEKERLKDYLAQNADYVATCENERTIPGRARPRLISVENCKNVVVSGITFGYSAAWNLHFVYCEDVITCGCKIVSVGVWNGDGIDPDSCIGCTIFDTSFDTHDDAVAIKSGKNPEGNKIGRPTKGVKIFDCHGMRSISIGSELSGGIEDVAVWDCNLNAFRVKTTKKRGGYVKNVRVFDSVFKAFVAITTKYPYNDDGVGAETLTDLRDFTFENVEIFGYNNERKGDFAVVPIQLIGFDDPQYYLRNVSINGVVLHPNISGEVQRIDIENVENASINNVSYKS